MAVLLSLVSPWKRKGEKGKKSYLYNTGYSYLVTHPSTVSAEQDLTLLSRRNVLLSLWYIDSTVHAFFKFLKWEKLAKREKKYLILHGWESREEKLEEYENENYYLPWWSETAHVLSPKMGFILW